MGRMPARPAVPSRRFVWVPILLASWWVLVLAQPAEAYIDPSAGGMLVQLLLAGTAGVAVLGKLMWSRIKRMLGFKDTDSALPGSDGPPPHDRV
jgi:CDP-diglyceride synthetase